MSKRSREAAGFTNRGGKPQRRKTVGAYSGTMTMPVRTYTPSRVPLASRGYRPNRTELKVFDTAVATYNVNSTVVFTSLCIPQLGSDMNNRIGRKINLKTVQIRGFLRIGSAAIQPPAQSEVAAQFIRMILVWDSQPNGAVPTAIQLLNTAVPESQLNLDGRDRFKVIRDKMYTLGPYVFDSASSTYNTERTAVPVKIFKKINLESIFSTSTGVVADITSGNLLIMWLGTGTGINGPSEFTGSYRVRFDDV